jgi:hypothetical protein
MVCHGLLDKIQSIEYNSHVLSASTGYPWHKGVWSFVPSILARIGKFHVSICLHTKFFL